MRVFKEPHGRPRTRSRMSRGTRRLVKDVPEYVVQSFPICDYGPSDGWAILATHLAGLVRTGELSGDEIRAALCAVAGLTSALLEAYLRGVEITDRAAAFDQLCVESKRLLTGRPNAVILQSGIV